MSALNRALILQCAILAGATAEIQTQHALDTSTKINQVELLWHVRLRTTPEGGGLSQVRMGPILEVGVNHRLTVIAGTYFTRQKGDGQWATITRPFGGGEVMLWDRVLEVDWRSLLERFVASNNADYFRFRNRFRVSPPGKTAPYASMEFFVDANGFRSARYSVGLRRVLGENLIVDFGYLFENRRPSPSGERHVFSTSFHWRNKTRRIDPDF